MKSFNLSETVMVSDPCYTIGTWCQQKLTDVLPGRYETNVLKTDNTGGWGNRIAALVAIHEDYTEDTLNWRTVKTADIGVDSGQAGIFSIETYRDDNLFIFQDSGFFGSYENAMKRLREDEEGGEHWYGHMCDRTCGSEHWGVYDNGVVSSTGYGDGSYKLLVAKDKGKIVGIGIDFFVLNLKNSNFNDILMNPVV